MLPPDVRPPFCIRPLSFESSRILSHHVSKVTFLCWHLTCLFLLLLFCFCTLSYCAHTSWILFALKALEFFTAVFFCLLCYPPWYLILCYYLGFFLPPSFNFSRPIQSVFAQHITSIVLPGLALLYGCYGPEKSAFVSNTINSNGCSQSLSSLCISWSSARREEKHTQPSTPSCFFLRTSDWMGLLIAPREDNYSCF